MSTESTVDYTVGLPEGSGAAVVAVYRGAGGHHWKSRHHAVFCGSVSTQNWLSFGFFFLFARAASNGLLIVYTASAAQHNKVALSSSPLPSLRPVFPVPPSALVLFNFLLFSSAGAGGWRRARRQPRRGSAAQTALCHLCAKVMLGGHIVFYE